jgi:endonuclease III
MLFPFVKNELSDKIQSTEPSTLREQIKQLVVSWFVRYKFRIILVQFGNIDGLVCLQETTRVMSFGTKLGILVRDIERSLVQTPQVEDEYHFIRNDNRTRILIQCIGEKLPRKHEVSYSIARNSGFCSLATFVNANTSPSADVGKRQIAICAWMQCYDRRILYEVVPPIRMWKAVELIESVLPSRNNNLVSKKSRAKRKHSSPNWKLFYRRRTRSTSALISQLLQSSSRSKVKMQYNLDKSRHVLGQPPKLTPPPSAMNIVPLDQQLATERVRMVADLEAVHSALVHLDILSPRDKWEEWIDNFKNEEDCDPAFMCLFIIIMSSSTSDNQLADLIPRLFSAGLTSAKAVIDIIQEYGLDTFCCLLSESGRYYQNAERILNAADYFVQRHKGIVPSSITIEELCSLYGVGYKTANVVVTTAFHRVDGIPSDVHVLRWCTMLGWSYTNDGYECSKLLESWLPRSKWESINPVFGAFGQLMVSDKQHELLCLARQHPSKAVRQLFIKASGVYKKADNHNKV